MHIEHKYVPDIGNRCKIADHPRKADLRASTIINAKAQGMLDRSRHDFPRNALRPVTVREEAVNRIQIKAGGIGANQAISAPVLDDHLGIGEFHFHILKGRRL
jgi:hypothetical protein